MTASLALVLAAGVLIAAGVYLTLERSLSRIVIGLSLMSNGVNLLFLVAGGRAGSAPINTPGNEDMADPLPHAMVLTAIAWGRGSAMSSLPGVTWPTPCPKRWCSPPSSSHWG